LRPIGLDRDRRMVLGFRASLRGAGDGALGVAGAGRLPLRGASVHGIATDPPYGRAASTRGEPIASLYERTFRSFRDLLPPGAYAAVVLPNEAMIDLASEHLERIEAHALRVHRSWCGTSASSSTRDLDRDLEVGRARDPVGRRGVDL